MSNFNYRDMPALASYIDRIGAEMLNFRRYMVKERRGKYYLERALIRIDGDGTIRCNTAEHKPTKEEVEAIKTAVAKCEWPRAIGAANTLKLKIPKDKLYEFWDRERRSIIMCQERVDTDDGGKYYVPWTFFSDGEWRRMEPDGKLPLWKPSETRNKSKVMVHEGGKAARFVDGLVNDQLRKKELAAHPWGDKLAEYEHWGMIGGALAPHRADYAELHAENPTEVVYVCDNDFAGNSALQEVSKFYGRPMKGIKFGQDFPLGWDLAELFPDKLRNKTLAEFTCPATYATEQLVKEEVGAGKPTIILKRCFSEEWIHSITPDAYIHKDWPNKIHSATEFDDLVNPYSMTPTTSRLIKAQDAIKSAVINYVPGEPPGLYGGGEAGVFINTHCESKIKIAKKGDPKPFLDYMGHLIPGDQDRKEVMRWIATLLARPKVKMMYALLLISETQGVGKSTLAEHILSPLLGEGNVSLPSEGEICESDYNYWMAHKRLALVNEIYAGHSSKAYNKLKDVITGRRITIKKKYMADYTIENWMHIIACSNNFNALKLTGDDRRWFIPKITEKKQPQSYWVKFNAWLVDGGLSIIKKWAEDFLLENDQVGNGEAAPWSAAKLNVIEAGYSPGMTLVANVLETIKESVDKGNPEFKRCIILDTDLVNFIKDNSQNQNQTYLERPATMRKLAKTVGWFVHDEKTQLRDGTRGRLICLDKADTERKPGDIYTEVIPTRIRQIGKTTLTLEEGGKINVSRDDTDDQLAKNAMIKQRLEAQGQAA